MDPAFLALVDAMPFSDCVELGVLGAGCCMRGSIMVHPNPCRWCRARLRLGRTSSSVRQRAVPTELQGRVDSVYLIGVFGGIVAGGPSTA